MGVFAKRTHDIVKVNRCFLQNEENENMAKDVFNFCIEKHIMPYDEKTKAGLIRHIMVRSGYKTGEVMVILVLSDSKLPNEEELVKTLTYKYPQIKTIVKNINKKDTNVILGNRNEILYGNGYIYDKLGKYTFKISPLSFYQINPIQTEVLYNAAINAADLTGKETIFDLYCGIGTIGIFASEKAKQVLRNRSSSTSNRRRQRKCKYKQLAKHKLYSRRSRKNTSRACKKAPSRCSIYRPTTKRQRRKNTRNNTTNCTKKDNIHKLQPSNFGKGCGNAREKI